MDLIVTMNTLLDELVRKGQKGHLGGVFYADDDIRKVMEPSAVRNALTDRNAGDDCKIEPHYIESAVKAICRDGHKVFAVLVYIRKTRFIGHFVKDNYLDPMLPFPERTLLKIIGEQTTALLFFNDQWKFAPPVFNESVFARSLPKPTILPFTKDKLITGGEGAFGIVSEIEMPSSHHDFPVSKVRLLGQ